MTTEAKFKHILMDLMKTKPLSDINVTLLCQRAGCHRQTFYYHYQDIYDLLSAIFLNEGIPGLEDAQSPKEVIYALFNYSKKNFKFLQAVYASAARELVDDFFYSRMVGKLLPVLLEQRQFNISQDAYRLVARRYCKMVGDEFGFVFKDAGITPETFGSSMKRFIDVSLDMVLPSLAEASNKERPKRK